MKIIVILFLSAFSMNTFSQDLPVINNLSKLNDISSKKDLSNRTAAPKKDFSFTVNPYFWTIAIGGTVGVPGTPVTYPQTYDFNKSFSDAIKDLKFAFMIGGKFKYKRMSLYYDVVYANLKSFGSTLPNGSGLASANVTFQELVTDLSIAYSFPTTSKSTFIDVYAGTRIWNVENEITLIATGSGASTMRNKSSTWVDPIVGMNVNFILSKDWFAYLRGDLGGFGMNSRFEFMILGGAGYKFSPNFNTTFGIKNLSVDYDKEQSTLNVNQYGFVLSLGYIY